MKKDNQTETSFELLLDKIQAGVFRQPIGKKPAIIFVNKMRCEMLGYAAKDLLAVEPHKIFTGKRAYEALVKRAQSGREIQGKEVILKAKDGERVSAFISFIAVKGTRGRARFIDVLIESAGTRHNVQKDLADSKELFKTVFNNSAAAIIVTDKDQHIIAWNPFAEKVLDMEREELFNRPVSQLYPPDEWKRLKAFHVHKKGVVSDIETMVLKKDGSILDVSLSLSVVKDIQGEAVGSIGIMRDVSIQKKTQTMLLEAKKVAEAASEAKTMFLANMSHEVRTPMNTILGMVDLTLDTELTTEQRDNLLTVKNAADILLSLLNDILDLSRVEAGKIQLESIEINVERIVRSVCKTMDILARNKGLKLQWVVDEAVPDMVKGDPVRIRQILVNLINNAIKFTKEGNIQVEVKVDLKEEDKC